MKAILLSVCLYLTAVNANATTQFNCQDTKESKTIRYDIPIVEEITDTIQHEF